MPFDSRPAILRYERMILMFLKAGNGTPAPSGVHLMMMCFLLDRTEAGGRTERYWVPGRIGPDNRFVRMALRQLVRRGAVRISNRKGYKPRQP